MKREVRTEKAPAPVGPYSQAIEKNNMLFISGQIGIDPSSGKLEDDCEAQIRRIFSNITEILKAGGYSLSDIVKVNVYLTEGVDFSVFNRLYMEFFEGIDVKPARSTVIVKALPLGACVEVDIIAVK